MNAQAAIPNIVVASAPPAADRIGAPVATAMETQHIAQFDALIAPVRDAAFSLEDATRLRNEGGARTFRAETFGEPSLWRGAAFADLNGDGAIDAIVTRLNGRPVLLENRMAAGRNWISFRVPLGTQVRIRTEVGEQWNQATSTVGYASATDPVVHFGLGAAKLVLEAEFRFPGGRTLQWKNLQVNRSLTP